MTRRDTTRIALVVAATALAWTGFLVHNLADLPGQSILSPESLLPTLVWMLALALWIVPATRTAGACMLLTWAVINLVGGAISVLPPTVLPFQPQQTLAHYAFHGLYAVTQLPPIVTSTAWLNRRDRGRRDVPHRAIHTSDISHDQRRH